MPPSNPSLGREAVPTPPPAPGAAPGFWAGYRAWLGERRGLLLGLFLLELALLAVLFLLTRTPEDPFAYGVF